MVRPFLVLVLLGFGAPAVPDRGKLLAELVDRYLAEAAAGRRDAVHAKIAALAPSLRELAEAAARGPALPPAPTGTRKIELTIAADGTRTTAMLTVPRAYTPARAWPLFVASHGTGMTGGMVHPFLEGLALSRGFLLVSPTGTAKYRDRGWCFTRRERSLHLSAISRVAREYRIDRNRVYLGGWSRGGHATWDVGVRYADRFAGLLPVVGGLVYRDLGLVGNLAGVRVHGIQGALDQPALVAAHRLGVAEMRRLGLPVTYEEIPGRGHGFFRDRLPGAVDDLLAHARNPCPSRVSLGTHGPPANRLFWLEIAEFAGDAWRPGTPIRIRGAKEMGDEERRKRIRDAVRRRTARAEAEIDPGKNRVSVRASRVRRLVLHLPLALLDPDRPVEIRVNGRRRRFSGPPDLRDLLDDLRARDGDRTMPVFGRVEIAVR